MQRNQLLLAVSFFLYTVAGTAQAPLTRAATKVTLELSKGPAAANGSSAYIGYFDQGMPFEKEFILHVNMAPADTAVMAADFSYTLDWKGFDCSKNSGNSLILPDFCCDDPAVSNFTNKGFDVKIRGIHPNKKYQFQFTFYSGLTAGQQQKLKAGIASAILQFFQLPEAKFDQATINARLTPLLTEAIKNAFGSVHLEDARHQPISVDDLATELMKSSVISTMITARETFEKRGANLKESIEEIDVQMPEPWFHQLLSDLPTWQWEDAGKALFASHLADTGELKDVSLETMITILPALMDTATLNSLLNGELTYQDELFVKKDRSTDMVFISAVRKALVEILRSLPFLKGPKPSANEKIKLGTLLRNLIGTWSTFIENFNVHQYGLYEKPVAADYVAGILPDAMVNYLIASNVTIQESTRLDDISTSNSAYISLDAGLGYVSGLYSVFTYYGVNFYPLPIDKTIPLSSYNARPFLRLLKSTCLTVGVLTNYFNNGNESKRYASLLGGSRDVFTGVGIRLTRVFKVNVGADWSYLNNENPLSYKRIVNAKLAVGLSLDINIIKTFSSLANAIGLSN